MDILRAINLILPALGEHPVSSVDSKHPTVAIILQNLQSELDEVLIRGWWFNTYKNVLYPDPEGVIVLPSNTLSVLTIRERGVQRGTKLFNRDTQTFVWSGGVRVEIIERLDFEDVPESAAQFILYTGMVKSYLTDIGRESVVQEWQQIAGRALNNMEAEHFRNMRYSTTNSRRYQRIRRALGGY